MDLVAIARVVRPRGIRGETVADVLTDFTERLDSLYEVLAKFPDGRVEELNIEKHWFQSGRMVLKFVGVDTVEAAESLRGVEICIDEADAVELEEGEFFDWQLEGCVAETIDGTELGTVKELLRTGGTELLVVVGEGREYLIPFAESICVAVDIDDKKITVDPPEGLLDF
jgi:16S rRNA processing protein RimM